MEQLFDTVIQWVIMNPLESAEIIAVAFVCLAAIPYSWGIIHKTTKPSLATWSVFSLVGTTIFAISWFETGGKLSTYLLAAYAVVPLVYVVLIQIFQRSRDKFTRLEKICLWLAGISWIIWLGAIALRHGLLPGILVATDVTPDQIAVFAAVLAVVTDLLGSLPTMKNSWTEPASESTPAWCLALLGSVTNLFVVDWHVFTVEWIGPIYYVINTLVIVLILFREHRHEPVRQMRPVAN